MLQQADNTTTTTAAFADRMTDLSTGMDLLIERLHHASDLASDLGAGYKEDGWYVVNAINETRWIAQRIGEEVAKVWRGLDVPQTEAAEASR